MYAIVIMARKPEPGFVKTRLVPPLSPEEASRLYHCFLTDKVEQVQEIKEASHFIAFIPDSSRPFFEDLVPSDFRLLSQRGEDLGERLANVSDTLFDEGYERIAIIDSDSPNLPTHCITDGLEALGSADVALGPCQDGGYYLIGLSSKLPQIFEGIPWSTPSVVEATVNKAREHGKTITLLPQWYDVDTYEDLKRLKRELTNYRKETTDSYFCSNTYRIISGR
ncbi:MAG: TIGR04282 family arsenosugar biosynthesis glycosyltransferase [Thermoplasmata archaeon]|nr:MAG: TIGR04282 family arsenosugar biosynthesis glycosyltransferase [Thermoplasmata archaeon]